MKKRLAKKMAKKYMNEKYMNGRLYLPFGTFEDEWQAYNDGTPAVIKTFARFPIKVRREIHEIAFRLGWDGCHWDDPLLLSIDDTEKIKYEQEFHPPHTW